MRSVPGLKSFNNLKTGYKTFFFIIIAGVIPILIQMIVGSFSSRNLVNSAKDLLDSQSAALIENQFGEYMMITAIVFLVNIVLISTITIIFIFSLINPISGLTSLADKIANRDLTNLDIKSEFRKDEIGKLEMSMNTALISLHELISVIVVSANQIDVSSDNLAITSAEINTLSEDIAATIQQISRGASNQAELSSRAIDEVMKMSEAVDQSLKDIEGTLRIIEEKHTDRKS